VTDSLFDLFTFHPNTTQNVADTTRMDAARQAAQKGIESAEINCDAEWFQSALDAIRAMPAGRRFLAEEVVDALRERGVVTPDNRAAGAVIRAAKSHGLIKKLGYMPAVTSHSSPKTLWERI